MRPIPQRAFNAPMRSAKVNSVDTCGTRLTGVSSQSRKPGVFSSITPLTAGVFGPQQGGLSISSPTLEVNEQISGFIFVILRI